MGFVLDWLYQLYQLYQLISIYIGIGLLEGIDNMNPSPQEEGSNSSYHKDKGSSYGKGGPDNKQPKDIYFTDKPLESSEKPLVKPSNPKWLKVVCQQICEDDAVSGGISTGSFNLIEYVNNIDQYKWQAKVLESKGYKVKPIKVWYKDVNTSEKRYFSTIMLRYL